MSILNYFKCEPKGSSEDTLQLPDPHGPLCARVQSLAIEVANKHVAKMLINSTSQQRTVFQHLQLLGSPTLYCIHGIDD